MNDRAPSPPLAMASSTSCLVGGMRVTEPALTAAGCEVVSG